MLTKGLLSIQVYEETVTYTDIKEQSPQLEQLLKYSLKKTFIAYISRTAILFPSPICSISLYL